jgi:hypothetical protein
MEDKMGRPKKENGLDLGEETEDMTPDGIEQETKTESPADKVEIIKGGVTRIRARADVPAYLAQGWRLK